MLIEYRGKYLSRKGCLALVEKQYTFTVTITPDKVEKFAELSGDFNPVHMDEQFCLEHGLKGRVVHGMLILSFVSRLLGMHLPGHGTLWLSQNIEFVLPARIGDTLSIRGIVIGQERSISLNLTILEIKIEVRNQTGKKILRGKVKVCVK